MSGEGSSKQYLQYVRPVGAKTLFRGDRVTPRQTLLWEKHGGIEAFPGYSGVGCTPTLAPKAKRLLAGCEAELSGQSNVYVITGNDRPGNICEGYGGRGFPDAGSIDICAEPSKAYKRDVDKDGKPVLFNPAWPIDAARVYVSGMTDADANCAPGGLPEGKVGELKAASAVVTIADGQRHVVRDGGYKIVAGMHGRDSAGQKIIKDRGIEFIVGNDGETQPLALAGNLQEYLEGMQKQISESRSSLSNYIKALDPLINAAINHNHNSPFYGQVTAMAFSMLFPGFKAKFQIAGDVETGILNGIVNSKQDEMALDPISASFIASKGVRAT